MPDWVRLVSDADPPADPAARVALAREALSKLAALERGLAVAEPDVPGLVALIRGDRSGPSGPELNVAETLFRWVWPLWANSDATPLAEILGPNPPRRFHALVTEGRGDLGFLFSADDEEEEDGAPGGEPDHVLAGEAVDQWVFLWHPGDGHQALFWDPTCRTAVRLLAVDNREPDVVVHDWSGEDFLVRRVFPDLIQHHREELEEELRTPLARGARDAVALGGIGALFAVTIGLIGLLVLAVRSCL